MTRAALAALVIAFTLAHLPYLASSLDDIDSVNFAMAIRDFDVAAHRPHPPGYPIYIALAKTGAALMRPFGFSSPSLLEARVLSALSLLGALGAIVLMYRVAQTWSRRDLEEDVEPADRDERARSKTLDPEAMSGAALAAASPLFWYLAIRPMSDVPGLAAALASQALLGRAWLRQQPNADDDRRLPPHRMAATGRLIVLGSLAAGLAIGFRSQNALLTLPLLLGVLVDRIGRGVGGALVGAAVAFGVGMLGWAVPLVLASGGLDGYLAALGTQAGEDFAAGEMLYVQPSPRLAAFALMRTFLYPWDSMLLGGIVLALAVVGAGVLLVRDRRSLVAVALASLPYLVFHLLFQDTTFVRYALPLVLPTTFLAAKGLMAIVPRAAIPATGVLALWGVAIASPVLGAYGRQESPTRRAVTDMQATLPVAAPGALAMHQTFRRPLEAESVRIEPVLPSPPRREWLELVRYWRDGQTAPIWFLADPRRSDLALIDPASRADRTDFTWGFNSISDVGGMRPKALTWYRLPAPGWFVEEGWALTPETAGVAQVMGRGPSIGPIVGWVRRRPEPARVMIGGRHLGTSQDPEVRFHVLVDGRAVAEWATRAGFFLHDFEIAPGALAGEGPLARLTVQSTSPGDLRIPTAVEQFDLQSRGSLMWGYGEGWHEAEYDRAIGVWRWTSDRATLRLFDFSTPVTIRIRAEHPRRYFDDDPTVRLRVGDRVLEETTFSAGELWSVDVPLDALRASGGRVEIETTRVFVPAERGGPPDRRRLGLRIFALTVAPMS